MSYARGEIVAKRHLKTKADETMDRRIELQGVTNFRDLGGYQTADGKTVRWRRIFRSDTVASLTDSDMETVCGLGVTVSCDLRYAEEREAEPSRFLGHDQVEALALGLDARPNASFLDSFAVMDNSATAAHAYLFENYRHYPFLYAKAYRTIFDRLIAGHRLIVHCTAGKDRAGTAAAMILTALGVPRQTVFEDYLLTNAYWDAGARHRPGMSAEAGAAIFSAREDYLTAAFDAIENRCGTVEAYLADFIGLDDGARQALRRVCLN